MLSYLLFSFCFLLQTLPEEVNGPNCAGANFSFLITCFAIDLSAAIACVFIKVFLDKQQKFSPAGRLGIVLFFAFAIGSALVAWNPFKNEMFINCLESNEYSRLIFMSQVAPIPRGMVLGGSGAIFLLLIILVLIGIFSSRDQ